MDQAFATLRKLTEARRSVRGFRTDPVPEAVLREVLELAQRAPSNCNIQPWVSHLVSGAAAERVRSALFEAARSSRPSPDFPFTGGYQGTHRERQVESAVALYGALGIARDDREARDRAMLDNYRFFDAPHALFVFMDARYGPREAADCGMYAQQLLLALAARGIAACAQGALGHYPDVVRDALGIPSSLHLLLGVAIGWEDMVHPANAARTTRVPLEQAVTFHR